MQDLEAKHQKPAESRRILLMIACLTAMFIALQSFLFFVHYRVSELVDSLVNSSITSAIFQAKLLSPILIFLGIQLIAYGIFISWVWFLSVAICELFVLKGRQAIYLSIVIWLLACLIMLGLNQYFYPHSFFANQYISNVMTVMALICMFVLTALAYINLVKYQSYRIPGLLFVTLVLIVGFDAVGYHYFSQQELIQTHSEPNILLIGLDSLRPDFTGYFSKGSVHTPNIDSFLSSASTFTHAYSPLARTFPAWMTVLTAKYPKHSGARNNLAYSQQLVKEYTLAKELKKAGYETIYATDEKRFSNITTAYGFDRVVGPGMGVNDFLLGGLADFPLTNLLVNLPFGRFMFPYNYGNRAAAVTYDPKNFLRLVKSGLMNRPNKPLFLAVHLCLAHWPFTWSHDQQVNQALISDKYRNSVEGVDEQLGQLLALLKKEGLLEHSIVVLLSDHGTTLGLPGDRILNKKNYVGNKAKFKQVKISKYNTAPEFSVDFNRDYGLDTSYGQGTDVLSLKQNHVLLAFKGYGVSLPIKQYENLSSLLDVAPTLLNYLALPAMKNIDGVSQLKNVLEKKSPARSFYTETGDSLSEIETDHIRVEKVVKQEVGIYRVNPETGLLYMDPHSEKLVLNAKQHAVMSGDWLLAQYPAEKKMKSVPKKEDEKNKGLELKVVDVPAYYVLVNLKTGKWTVDLRSSFAKSAPLSVLQHKLKAFYGKEIV